MLAPRVHTYCTIHAPELPYWCMASTSSATVVWKVFAALTPVIAKGGAYNPREMSKLLNWEYDEMADYLEVSRSSVEKGQSGGDAQDKLQELAGLYLRILEAFYGLCPNSTHDTEAVATIAKSQATAWLNTPLAALDDRRPKDLILDGKLDVVRSLVDDASDESSA